MARVLCIDLGSQSYSGPEEGRGAYTSFSVLDPAITIERHSGKYHVTARFNLETNILRYSVLKGDDHEWFFNDICLHYMNADEEDDLYMRPESDPAAAFTVTTNHNTSITGQIGATASPTPSASVQLDLAHSSSLTVQYALSTWTLSANKVVNVQGELRTRGARERTESIFKKLPPKDSEDLRHQWFWRGTQDHTRVLTPDLRETVKRHVLVKRMIPIKDFPSLKDIQSELEGVERDRRGRATAVAAKVAKLRGAKKDTNEAEEMVRALDLDADRARAWIRKIEAFGKEGTGIHGDSNNSQEAVDNDEGPESTGGNVPGDEEKQNGSDESDDEKPPKRLGGLLEFRFRIMIRVKQRYGRLHRLLVFSGNKKKGDMLKPTYEKEFSIKADMLKLDARQIPQQNTIDIMAELATIKDKNNGKWDELQSMRLVDIEVPPERRRHATLAAGDPAEKRTYDDSFKLVKA